MHGKSYKPGLILLAAFCVSASLAHARSHTIRVPANQPTIQAAIAAAVNGDTVLVSPGTYRENINFMGKAITVTSSGGAGVTTIDGGGAGSVVTFNTGEGNASVLNGFTIMNGAASQPPYFGGGIYISGASPTVSGNTITGNTACAGGGGIASSNGSPVIQGNMITNNSQAWCSGGSGGGISIGGGSQTQIINNVISGNTWLVGDGGGIGLNGAGGVLIKGNTISGNSASGVSPASRGGGISSINGSSATIVQNLIFGNSAGKAGDPTGGQGGGIAFLVPSGSRGPYLINNTIASNIGAGGSGVYMSGFDAQSLVENNLILATAGQPAVFCDNLYSSTPPILQSNDAFSSGGTAWDGSCAGAEGSNGNISADPLFFNAGADFHLQSGSPAIDTGNNSAPNLPATDLDGNPRIVDSTNEGAAVVDMGVYEFFPTTDTLSPTSLDFGSLNVGTASGPLSVTLTNTGSQKLLLSISISANYSETDDCRSSLAPGAHCTLNVTFAPTVGGTLNGALTLHNNATSGPQTVALTGTGVAPVVNLSTGTVIFGMQAVGTTSSAQWVFVSNWGNAALSISSLTASGDFAQTNTCGNSLAPGAECRIDVTFTPTYGGYRTGLVTLTDNAPNSPQMVSLSGWGETVSLTPTNLAFGNQNTGTTSAPQTVTLTNTSGANLAISNVYIFPPFGQTNNCGTSLAAGASCTFNVTFTPTVVGNFSGELIVYDNTPEGSQYVFMSGTGQGPMASLNPLSLNFSAQLLGNTSSVQAVSLQNSGNAALNITSIYASGDFAASNNCGTSLAPNAACSISVTFTPTAAGTRSGAVFVIDDAAGSPQQVTLSGTGTLPLSATLSPTSLSFGDQLVGTASAARQVTLQNTGSGPLTISGITASGDFVQSNNCGTTLGTGASCTINVTFVPTAMGIRSGTLSVSENAQGSSQTAALSGTGTSPAATLAPSNVSFGSQVEGTTSAPQGVTLSNPGNATLTISAISVTGNFAQTNNCGTTLAASASCAISVTFTPAAFGMLGGTLTVLTNAPGPAPVVALSGSGVAAAPTLSPPSLDFSSQNVGTPSASMTVKLTANGPGPLLISSVAATGEFQQTNNCPASLKVGGSCNISVSFYPTTTGPASGALTITDNGLGSPQIVPLSGTGEDFSIAASPSSATINPGAQANFTVTVAALGGAFNNSVSLACAGLPAGAKCAFSPISVTPQSGSATSALTIQTTAKKGNSSTPPGSYAINITGTSGALVRSAVVTLVVN
jgi:Right handed beta helix region/Cep192 domain 4/HYDIN/CFA65/VesB-like, Ig-like domain/Abnormal spindle-like microcephaly-assoc'd, ASPM-SPD-2-Hydin